MHRALSRIIALAATIAACSGGSDSASSDIPCEGSAGGGLTLTDRTEMVFTVAFREDSSGDEVAQIEAVIVGRGAPGWKATMRDRKPASTTHDSASLATMADIGLVKVGYDRRSHVAWIQNESVALDSFNVVLLDRVDSAGGGPVIAQRLRLAPTIPLAEGACAARMNPTTMAWADSIRARLMSHAQVRAFAAP